MNYRRLSIRNFGPVETGTIDNQKIIVFFGPNNSGKSMISKLIHAISLFDPSQNLMMRRSTSNQFKPIPTDHLMITHVLRNMGLPARSVVTHGKKKSAITIENGKEDLELEISSRAKMVRYFAHRTLEHYTSKSARKTKAKQSLYIPAGRTGTIQSFYSIAQMRNRLLADILSSFESYGYAQDKFSSAALKRFLRSTGSFPDSMNEFYDVILDAYAKGMPERFQDRFHGLFSGYVRSEKAGLVPSMVFEDRQGLRTNLENTGSGVVSSLPILLGIDYVRKGGSLIIEEPEAHMEPTKQYGMMDELYQAHKTKKIRLILTTHSEYIVRKLLSMVSQKKLRPSDLGLYYFDRTEDSYTTIQRMTVDKTGEAEQPIFQEALEIMVGEFLK